MIIDEELFDLPIAHRGLHDATNGVIENSMEAFERAIAGGYAIECDVQLSADNVPVVFHDSGLDRLTGQAGQLSQLSAAQIGNIPLAGSTETATIPSLKDLLNLVQGQVPLFVELKPQTDGRNVELANATLATLTNSKGPLALMSFSPYILQALRKDGYDGALGALVERFDDVDAKQHTTPFQRFILRHLLHYPWTRFDFVDCRKDDLRLPAVRLSRALGFPLACWTITSQVEATQALKHCDQITFEGFHPQRG